MIEFAAISTPIWVSSPPISISISKSRAPKTSFTGRFPFPQNPVVALFQAFPFLSAAPPNSPVQKHYKARTNFSLKAAAASPSVGGTDYTEEPATGVKFQTLLTLPGCSSALSLLGTGYREKVFAIIGVKVYAAGLYIDLSILKKLGAGKGKSAAELQGDASLFDLIFQGKCPLERRGKEYRVRQLLMLILQSAATLEKSLHIVLVRDVDGKTFWGALDGAISPRIKSPTPDDESALSTFRGIFQGRSLKKGTFIFLTWLNPTKMLVSVSSAGMPSGVDATIQSKNVTLALFDVFFGLEPVSPSLKASVANGLATALK